MTTNSKRFSLSNLSLPLSSSSQGGGSGGGGTSSRAASPNGQLLQLPLGSPAAQGVSTDPFGSPRAGEPAPSSMGAMVVQRDELHKQLRALDTVLQLLASYQSLVATLAKTEGKLAKACVDVLTWSGSSSSTGSAEVVFNSLSSSSQLFSQLSSVTSKHSKALAASTSALQDALVKHFKKCEKLERVHDGFVVEREGKLRKSAGGLEKSLGKGAASGVGRLGGGGKEEKLLGALRGLGEEINNAKEAHLAQTSHLQTSALLMTASHLTSLASAQFTASTEGVRKTAPVVGDVLRWKAFADAGWLGAAGLADLTLPAAGRERWVDGIEHDGDNDEQELRPPDRSFAGAGSPSSPSSPRARQQTMPSSPLTQQEARKLPVAPARSPSFDAPPTAAATAAAQPNARQYAPTVSSSSDGNSQRNITGALTFSPPVQTRKKVGYADRPEVIPHRSLLPADAASCQPAGDDDGDGDWDQVQGRAEYEAALRNEQRRLEARAERDRLDAVDREQQIARERERQKHDEAAARALALEHERQAFEREHERLARAEEEESRRRLLARREEDERIRLAREKEDRAAAEQRERELAGAKEADAARVKVMKERFEDYRRQSVPQPTSPTTPPSGAANLGRRVSQLSARYEEISQTSDPSPRTAFGGGGGGAVPQGPRRNARNSTSAFDPAANTRPLAVPPSNHRRTTYPLAAAPAARPVALPQGSGSLISMANGGGVLMRDDGGGGGAKSYDEREWAETVARLGREDSVREGEMRFREPPASVRGRPAHGDETWR